ncbi:MAG TPA: acetylornithine transaminase [Candidatus Acidoferrum sp.]|jgi:acetylornithine aminotransferase/acetylornithine/N-succinyldiaminopimelate aminotransferase|nr:acetylornithine transaminase [Candidatus Acidoferrum sp.]
MDTKTLMEWSAKYHTPNYGRTPLVLVRGEGTRVWDSDGKEYLDFTTGIAVTGLGHCHPVITGAIREAAATLLHVSNIFHNAPQVHLAKLLVEHSFADRVFFCNSGAEANEAALKVVRKYAKERLSTDRYEVIATNNSFHGRTLATVSATGQPKYHHGFEPLMPGFKHVPYNDLKAMERALDSRTAAILVEPIQGEGGVNIPDDGYLPGLRKLCDESGALLVFDEVQTGVGRTGKLWAYEHSGVEPDVMTLAKALANGIPIGAMLCREEVAAALTAGSHGSTFAGSAFVTSVALATLTTVIGDKLPQRAAERGRELMDGVRALQRTQPAIKEVRGRGLLIGIELTKPAGPVMDACREAGLLVLTAGEKVVRLAPPLIVESGECKRALDILSAALGASAK